MAREDRTFFDTAGDGVAGDVDERHEIESLEFRLDSWNDQWFAGRIRYVICLSITPVEVYLDIATGRQPKEGFLFDNTIRSNNGLDFLINTTYDVSNFHNPTPKLISAQLQHVLLQGVNRPLDLGPT
ncbi:MAG: hypothetical protein M1826_000784 [Phylliscum demangeonii]|nr:MAG: hypothetical protein M1826_000784 [Phylliscum demangeonii]